jgi:GTP cyclohydrolase-4
MTDVLDVQGSEMSSSFILSRVGIQGVKRPVTIKRGERSITLIPVFDISVNLPSDQKGSHMSRHVEVIHRAVDQAIDDDNDSLERLVERISRELLRSHEYATYADVKLKADYFIKKDSPDGRVVTENYRIFAESRIERGEEVPWRSIGIEVAGMSACPCAMENVREMLREELASKGFDERRISVLDEIPVPTHNQQNRAYLEIGMKGEMDIEAEDLIQLVENNLSSPTYEVLKRKGEAMIVLQAHRNPKFVEDIVRDIIDSFLGIYRDLPDHATLHVRSISEESIHKHDAFAERITTLGELRKSTKYERPPPKIS